MLNSRFGPLYLFTQLNAFIYAYFIFTKGRFAAVVSVIYIAERESLLLVFINMFAFWIGLFIQLTHDVCNIQRCLMKVCTFFILSSCCCSHCQSIATTPKLHWLLWALSSYVLVEVTSLKNQQWVYIKSFYVCFPNIDI